MPKLNDRNSFFCEWDNPVSKKREVVEFFVETPHQQGISRKVAFSKEAVRLAFGTDLKGVIGGVGKVIGAIDGGSLSRAGFEAHSLVYRLGEISDERDPALWLCTLFVNINTENRRTVPRDEERQWKIDVWTAAGIAFPFFIDLLSGFNDTLAKLYENSTRSSSEGPASQKAE